MASLDQLIEHAGVLSGRFQNAKATLATIRARLAETEASLGEVKAEVAENQSRLTSLTRVTDELNSEIEQLGAQYGEAYQGYMACKREVEEAAPADRDARQAALNEARASVMQLHRRYNDKLSMMLREHHRTALAYQNRLLMLSEKGSVLAEKRMSLEKQAREALGICEQLNCKIGRASGSGLASADGADGQPADN